MPPSAKKIFDSPSMDHVDVNGSNRQLSAANYYSYGRSRKAGRRTETPKHYDPRRAQQRRPRCHVTVEFPPFGKVSPRNQMDKDGRLRVHSHLPILQSFSKSSSFQHQHQFKVHGQCNAATTTRLFGPSSTPKRSGSIGLTALHVYNHQSTTISLHGMQPEARDLILEEDSNSTAWQQQQQTPYWNNPHVSSSIATCRRIARTSYNMGATWSLPLGTRRAKPSLVGSFSVAHTTTGFGFLLQSSLSTRLASLSPSLNCDLALSPHQKQPVEQENSSKTTKVPSWWTLRLGSSISPKSGWKLRLLQLRLAARRSHSVILSWGFGGWQGRCDCALWSSSSWRLGVLLNGNRRWSSMRWTLSLGTAVSIQLPIFLGSAVASSTTPDWWWAVGSSLVLSLVQHLLERALAVQRNAAPTTASRSISPDAPNAELERARSQQRLMQRQASRRTTRERSRQGLVIEQAVYSSLPTTLTTDQQQQLDVTIPLQFWVQDDSTLQLYGNPRRHMLGFCALGENTTMRIVYSYGGTRYVLDGITEEEEVMLPNRPRARPLEP